MTNFLSLVAGRVLGVVPLAQPILPARFDPVLEKSVRPEKTLEEHSETSAEGDFASLGHDALRGHEPTSISRAIPRFKGPVLDQAIQPTAFHRPLMAEPQFSGSPIQEKEVYGITSRTGQRMRATEVKSEPSADSSTAQVEISHKGDLDNSRSHRNGAFGNRMNDEMVGSVRNQFRQPAHPPAPDQSSPSAPVVRVTIGRIDVRAELTSPPAPPARRTRSSVLSLDQFLKQQSEAGR